MAQVLIGLGSNLGDRGAFLQEAWQQLAIGGMCKLQRLSSPYLSEPVGIETDNWFINAAGLLETALSASELLTRMLTIETDLGRDRSKGDDRTIDLDLLYYDNLVINEPGLILPHPGISSRLFVLCPLLELAPDFLDPATGLSVQTMHEALVPDYQIRKISWEEK